MKSILATTLTLFAASSVADIANDKLPEVAGLYQHNSHLISAGAPKSEDYAPLATAGVDVVINVIPHDSQWDKDNGFIADPIAARKAGMMHITVPFDSENPVATMEHFIGVMDRLNATEKDVLVHCALNWRASGMVYFYHAIKNGQVDKSELAPWGDFEKSIASSAGLQKFFKGVEAHYHLPASF
ncbi:beta-lactamase hydrolase domain-containing protein [Ferrimonas senticii]|uniref:beta-lactamase hydrolase domain-containing protein n=1 Tax=Ferrimonas senticii TaxID=394566 RepID=UPI00041FD4AB|nr:sulfur transferase domain-containing protein [Ferrimonas senticii]